jgi:anti-sigma-K factor RskA
VSGPMDSCPVNEQAAAWALHALEPDEEASVLRHLPTCPSCRAVAADAEEVLARMGAAVEQVDPPPSLRSSLMAEVANTPQYGRPTPPQQRPATSGADTARHRSSSSRPADSRPSRSAGRPRRGRRLVAAAVALVGVLAIGGLAARTVQLQQQRDTEVAQTQTLNDLLGQLGRPGSRYALLAPENGSTVAAVVVADGQRQVFSLGLPTNSVDRDTYVLWGLPDKGNPEPLGTFDVAGTGPDARTVGASATADSFGKYAISIEPGRTAPAIPTTVVAVGAVEA